LDPGAGKRGGFGRLFLGAHIAMPRCPMRAAQCIFAGLIAVAAGTVSRAEEVDALLVIKRLAGEGAPELALYRVESLQPPPADKTRWADWERLRFDLLERLERDEEIAKRAASLPPDAPTDLARRGLFAGARAALRTKHAAQARGDLARLFWQAGVAPEDERGARMLVIDTYLNEKRPSDAYRAMLRFQQDFAPLARAEGERFADSLARQGMYREAATWLSYLDESNPTKLLVQMETGLVSPDEAIARARAALKKGSAAGPWRVLARAAAKKNDPGLRLEATEQLLNQPGRDESVTGSELWGQYVAYGDDLANREQLLRGDDSAWLALAGRMLVSSPHSARALLAHIAVKAGSQDTRRAAFVQIAGSMQRQKLGLAAARVVPESQQLFSALDSGLRQSLGQSAFDAGEAGLALEYWRGMGAPVGTSPDAWQLRVASAALKAGRADEAGEALRPLLAGQDVLAHDTALGVLRLAQEAAAKGQAKAAEGWLGVVAVRADAPVRREALIQLGRIAEDRGEQRAAAERYLQAAVAVDLKTPDAVAVEARLRAARSLAAAGYRTDARAQYERLRKSVRDRELQDLLRRESERL
jgi:hypothetical protein